MEALLLGIYLAYVVTEMKSVSHSVNQSATLHTWDASGNKSISESGPTREKGLLLERGKLRESSIYETISAVSINLSRT